jgi:hypothetical protein
MPNPGLGFTKSALKTKTYVLLGCKVVPSTEFTDQKLFLWSHTVRVPVGHEFMGSGSVVPGSQTARQLPAYMLYILYAACTTNYLYTINEVFLLSQQQTR